MAVSDGSGVPDDARLSSYRAKPGPWRFQGEPSKALSSTITKPTNRDRAGHSAPHLPATLVAAARSGLGPHAARRQARAGTPEGRQVRRTRNRQAQRPRGRSSNSPGSWRQPEAMLAACRPRRRSPRSTRPSLPTRRYAAGARTPSELLTHARARILDERSNLSTTAPAARAERLGT